MKFYGVPLWKKAPFIRLLPALIAGILLQWYLDIPWLFPSVAGLISLITLMILFFTPVIFHYRFGYLSGIAITFLFISIGAILTYQQDIRNNPHWIGFQTDTSQFILVTLLEDPIEKPRSFKAEASLSSIIYPNQQSIKGKILLYFKKDSTLQRLSYGSQLIFRNTVQPVTHAGNPGGFNYRQYALFQGITHQVYLTPTDYIVADTYQRTPVNTFINTMRDWVLTSLRKYIPSSRELGLSEALLIGYKQDLDPTLIQSYSRTGVVHVIAISGLHLGLIYWLLAHACYPLQRSRKLKWLKPVVVISGLWIFSLLAGAQPSILRSAVMFTCIVLGESLRRKTSVYNSLAFSAFLLLCINPFWLWDAGFLLSYSAVTSLVIFFRPIHNLLFFRNKIVQWLWQLNAVTLAAQVLTVPLCIYLFHQFPNYFLLANLVAVPISSLILIGLIFLCAVSPLPVIAYWVGLSMKWLTWLLNSLIEKIEQLPFSVWTGLEISLVQTGLLYACIIGAGIAWLQQSIRYLQAGIIAFIGFFILRTQSFIIASKQQQIVIYNIPRQTAVDFISGRQADFAGDTAILIDPFIQSFHLAPSRALYRVSLRNKLALPAISFHGKKIVFIDSIWKQPLTDTVLPVDILILSKKANASIVPFVRHFTIAQIITDASYPSWKKEDIRRECDSLAIPFHDVVEKGAFVVTLR